MKKIEVKKKDTRVIPKLFRAIERYDNPLVVYGFLISDDGFNFTSFSSKDTDDSQFKERILKKSDFSFSSLDKESFSVQANIAIFRMAKDVEEKGLEFGAAQAKHQEAVRKLEEILRVYK